MRSHLRCTAIKVTFPGGAEELIVDLALDCPSCGQGTIRLAGHHLRAMRDALIEMIALHPGLTGADQDVQRGDSIVFGAGGPPDSSIN